MTKVLFITPDFYPNSTGFANASINLIEAIKKYGHEQYDIHVFTTVPLGDKLEVEGIRVLRYQEKSSSRLSFELNQYKKFKAVKSYVQNNKIDVIFFETNTFPYFQNWIVKEFKDKVFVRIHSTADTEVPVYNDKKWYKPNIIIRKYFSFMQEVSNILSTSNYYLDFIKREYLKGNPYKIWNEKTYGLLFNTGGIEELPEINIEKSNTFMTMGKLSKNGFTQKGISDLLRSIYYLKAKDKLPSDFLLRIVGNGVMLPVIKNYIKKLGIEEFIDIIETATHEEVFQLQSRSKAIILLSRYEGQSMFITEALAMGKPLVLSDNNGMHEMIQPGKNGFLVRTGDSKNASEVIEKFFNMSHEELKAMSYASRNIYLNKFSSEAVFKQFDESIKLKY